MAGKPAGTGLEFLGYFFCSALAFVTDYALFGVALQMGIDYRWAACLGFSAGLIVAYRLSVRWVFRIRRIADRRHEFVLFTAIGLLGLGLTELILWALVASVWATPMTAKLVATGTVFLFNFGCRKALLFTRHP